MTSITLPRYEIGGLSAIIAGDGNPVLLLHGVGLRAEAWQAQIDALCAHYHVIAPDMPGHGQSPHPTGLRRLADYAQAYLPVLEQLGRPVMIVGHSMGAMIALELASREPEKVRAVAALNAIFERSPKAAQAVQERAAALDGVTASNPEATLNRWFADSLSKERDACETWLRAGNPAGYKLAYTAFAHAEGPSRRALETLACPALFATGALEPNSTPEMSRAMAGIAPHGRVQIVENAAHMMPMTHADEVNAALLNLAREVYK